MFRAEKVEERSAFFIVHTSGMELAKLLVLVSTHELVRSFHKNTTTLVVQQEVLVYLLSQKSSLNFVNRKMQRDSQKVDNKAKQRGSLI